MQMCMGTSAPRLKGYGQGDPSRSPDCEVEAQWSEDTASSVCMDLSCLEFADESLRSPWLQVSGSSHRRLVEAWSPEGFKRYQVTMTNNEDNAEELSSLLSKEETTQPPRTYLHDHPFFDAEQRHMLVSWMLTASRHLRFSLSTTSLAVNLLDRFLATPTITEQWALPLAAVACLSIGAKKVEGYKPDKSIAELQVDAPWVALFNGSVITRMELMVLTTLGWRVVALTPHDFLDPLLIGAGLGYEPGLSSSTAEGRHAVRGLAKDLICKTFLEERYLAFRPSAVAGAAILAAVEGICLPAELSATERYLCDLINQAAECRSLILEDFGELFGGGAHASGHCVLVQDRGGKDEPCRHGRRGSDRFTPSSVLELGGDSSSREASECADSS